MGVAGKEEYARGCLPSKSPKGSGRETTATVSSNSASSSLSETSLRPRGGVKRPLVLAIEPRRRFELDDDDVPLLPHRVPVAERYLLTLFRLGERDEEGGMMAGQGS